ncbi:MAG: amidohydrolase family protein [Chitinophagales bacterium]
MKKILSIFVVLLFFSQQQFAQNETPTFPVNGVHDNRAGLYALTNATIHTTYNTKLDKATLLIRNGKVEQVGASVSVPKDAVVIDMQGQHIYPSFIDAYANYGLPEVPKNKGKWTDPPKDLSSKKGAYGWNEAIKPEISAVEHFTTNAKAAESYRKLGFGTVLSHQQDGIARGTGTVVLLNEGKENEVILKDEATAHYSFDKGESSQDYPSSLMGSIALLRQTYYDAQWYKAGQNVAEFNLSLDSWNNIQNLPQIFEASDRLSVLRADKVGDEFGVQYIFKGNGDEYKRLDALKNTNASFILPLNFPDAYDVEDPFDASNVSLSDMKHWELAPSNASFMQKAGIEFALTTADLKDKKAFFKNLQKAIEAGLSKETALKALTYTPANMLGMYREVGSLEKGKIANFIVCSKPIFDEKATIYENWVKGNRFVLKDKDVLDLAGNYELKLGNVLSYDILVSGDKGKQKVEIVINDSTKIAIKHTLKKQAISLNFNAEKDSVNAKKMGKGIVRLSGWTSEDGKKWKGNGQLANGDWIDWTALPTEKKAKEDDKKDKKAEEKKKDKKEEKDEIGTVMYPFLPYGWEKKPTAETVVFKNVTVWTNEKDGILTETDVLIQNGKIAGIGKNLKANGGKEVDGTGKHLTSGVIDEHSHIAISKGVNEGTQASSAEVSIATVINSEDINIYRQLSGGVTTSQLLHGSANPIGGQSGIIKLRWGSTPEEMKFKGADGFIKFALGENVKQSNWGDSQTTRFPQTRMGVEQVFVDGFTRAKAYGEKMYGNKKAPKEMRRDLELDALWEIINKKRFITCHSYVQSEITMLMRVAEQFNFNINTFTHILEGYKIADKMKKHGVAGSTFSDWWAYKYEVIDAIPHNGAIMHEMGVLTAFNSDDAEMARRLNQEAAKAVKYGDVSEEEAWKFVTLNPAKMLHIDDKVGSIKKGKDADVVLWSDNPLSIYARAEQTYVDGICYFDIAKDEEMRKEVAAERNRLIQKMLAVKAGGGKTQKGKPSKKRLYHCNDLGDGEQVDFYEKDHKGCGH